MVWLAFASVDFISRLYMSINIYKQCKIAVKATRGEKTPHPEMTGAQPRSGINLRVIKNEGEIISDRLMELHHAQGQRASPTRNNNGRTRGTPTVSVALGLLGIQNLWSLEWAENEICVFHATKRRRQTSSQNDSLSLELRGVHIITRLLVRGLFFISGLYVLLSYIVFPD